MFNSIKGLFSKAGSKSISEAFEANNKLLQELERFNKEQLPQITKSNCNAISALEQLAQNIKATIKVK